MSMEEKAGKSLTERKEENGKRAMTNDRKGMDGDPLVRERAKEQATSSDLCCCCKLHGRCSLSLLCQIS